MTTQSLKFKRKFKTEDTEKNWSCTKTLKSVRIDLDEIKDKYSNIQIEYVERTNESTTKLTKRTSECLCVVIPLKKDHINYCLGLTSIVEAMAMGKPVICTYNPYSPIDIEKEGIGLTVNEDRSWEEAITYIISHREKAQEMGLRGRLLAKKHFNIRKCFELVDEAIEKKDED